MSLLTSTLVVGAPAFSLPLLADTLANPEWVLSQLSELEGLVGADEPDLAAIDAASQPLLGALPLRVPVWQLQTRLNEGGPSVSAELRALLTEMRDIVAPEGGVAAALAARAGHSLATPVLGQRGARQAMSAVHGLQFSVDGRTEAERVGAIKRWVEENGGTRVITKLLIANRGDPAIRAIRAVQEFNRAHGLDIKVVVVHAPQDANDLFVQLADEAIPMDFGRPADAYQDPSALIEVARAVGADALYPGWGFLSEKSEFARAVEKAGLTFIGPDADFMETMGHKHNSLQAAATFDLPVGNFSKLLVTDAEKVQLRELTERRRTTEQEALIKAIVERALATARQQFDFPNKTIMIKDSWGGGGTGNKRIKAQGGERTLLRAEEDFRSALSTFLNQGKWEVFIEEFMGGEGTQVHHIEFQVVGDGKGGVVCLGWRECSDQRRDQKVFEKTATNVPLVLLTQIEQRLVRMMQEKRLRGASTFEFLVARKADDWGEGTGRQQGQGFADAETDDEGTLKPDVTDEELARWKAKFMEVNARLQVEHGITEVAYSFDIFHELLRIGCGMRLSIEQKNVHQDKVTIEARILAEDDRFRPQTGQVQYLLEASGPGIRMDSAVAPGQKITSEFDSMIAKLIVSVDMPPYDPLDLADRRRAMWAAYQIAVGRLRRALRELKIGPLRNNVPLLADFADTEVFATGQSNLATFEGFAAGRSVHQAVDFDQALSAAVVKAYLQRLKELRDTHGSPSRLLRSSELPSTAGSVYNVQWREQSLKVMIAETGPNRMEITYNGKPLPVTFVRVTDEIYRIEVDGVTRRVLINLTHDSYEVEIDAAVYSFQVSAEAISQDRSLVTCPGSGKMWLVHAKREGDPPSVKYSSRDFKVGDRVEKGQVLAFYESMKMEIEVEAERSGRLVWINPDYAGLTGLDEGMKAISEGTPLFRIEPDEAEEDSAALLELPFAVHHSSTWLEQLKVARDETEAARLIAQIQDQMALFLPQIVTELHRYFLGYDYPSVYIARITDLLRLATHEPPDSIRALEPDLLAILQAFSDLEQLYSARFRSRFDRFRYGVEEGHFDDGGEEFTQTVVRALNYYGAAIDPRAVDWASIEPRTLTNILFRIHLSRRDHDFRRSMMERVVRSLEPLRSQAASDALCQLIDMERANFGGAALRRAAENALFAVDIRSYRLLYRPPVATQHTQTWKAFDEDDEYHGVGRRGFHEMQAFLRGERSAELFAVIDHGSGIREFPETIRRFIEDYGRHHPGITLRRLYSPFLKVWAFEVTHPIPGGASAAAEAAVAVTGPAIAFLQSLSSSPHFERITEVLAGFDATRAIAATIAEAQDTPRARFAAEASLTDAINTLEDNMRVLRERYEATPQAAQVGQAVAQLLAAVHASRNAVLPRRRYLVVGYNEGEATLTMDAEGDVVGSPVIEDVGIRAAETVHALQAMSAHKGNEVFLLQNEQYPLDFDPSGSRPRTLSALSVGAIGNNIALFFSGASIAHTVVVLPVKIPASGERTTIGFTYEATGTGLQVQASDWATFFEPLDRGTERQRARGLMIPEERARAVFDEGIFEEVTYAGIDDLTYPDTPANRDKERAGQVIPVGVKVYRGLISGKPATIYAFDFREKGGAFGSLVGRKLLRAQFEAYMRGEPVIGLMDGSGADINEGLVSLNHSAEDFMMKVITQGYFAPELFARWLINHPDRKTIEELLQEYGSGGLGDTVALRADRRFQDLVGKVLRPSFSAALQVGAGIGMVVYGSSLLPIQTMLDLLESYRGLTGRRVKKMAMGEDVPDYVSAGAPVHARRSGEIMDYFPTEAELYQHLRRLIDLFHPQARMPLPAIDRSKLNALLAEARERQAEQLRREGREPSEGEEIDLLAAFKQGVVNEADLSLLVDNSSFIPYKEPLQGGEAAVAGFGKLAGLPAVLVSPATEHGFGTYQALFKVREAYLAAESMRLPIINIVRGRWVDAVASENPRASRTRRDLWQTVGTVTVPQFSIATTVASTLIDGPHAHAMRMFFVNNDGVGEEELERIRGMNFEIVESIEEAMDEIAETMRLLRTPTQEELAAARVIDPKTRKTHQAEAALPDKMDAPYDVLAVVRDVVDGEQLGAFRQRVLQWAAPLLGAEVVEATATETAPASRVLQQALETRMSSALAQVNEAGEITALQPSPLLPTLELAPADLIWTNIVLGLVEECDDFVPATMTVAASGLDLGQMGLTLEQVYSLGHRLQVRLGIERATPLIFRHNTTLAELFAALAALWGHQHQAADEALPCLADVSVALGAPHKTYRELLAEAGIVGKSLYDRVQREGVRLTDEGTRLAAETIFAGIAPASAHSLAAVLGDYEARMAQIDPPVFQEIWRDINHPKRGPSLVVGLARVGGRLRLVIADQPQIRSGTPEHVGAWKFRKAVMLAQKLRAFAPHLGIWMPADAPGFDPSAAEDAANIQGEGAEAIEVIIRSMLPVVIETLRKGYGGRWIQAFHAFLRPGIRAFIVRGAEVAVMGPGGKIAALDWRELDRGARLTELIERLRAEGYGNPALATESGAADAIIGKADLRTHTIEGFERAEADAELAFVSPVNTMSAADMNVTTAMQRLESLGFMVRAVADPTGTRIEIRGEEWRTVLPADRLLEIVMAYPSATRGQMQAFLDRHGDSESVIEMARARQTVAALFTTLGIQHVIEADALVVQGARFFFTEPADVLRYAVPTHALGPIAHQLQLSGLTIDVVPTGVNTEAAQTYHFTAVSSTNDVAKELARRGAASGSLVLADTQTAGRGRRLRHWHSPPGLNLYASYLHRVSTAYQPADIPRLNVAVSLAVTELLQEQFGIAATIKWPNDVYVGDKKIAGILTELTGGSKVLVAGLGLNLRMRHADLPPELQGWVTSVAEAAGTEPATLPAPAELGPLLQAKLIATLALPTDEVERRYNARAYWPVGTKVRVYQVSYDRGERVLSQAVKATVVGIDFATGRLIVKRTGRRQEQIDLEDGDYLVRTAG